MIRVFRIGGIPVRLDAGWAVIFGVLAWSLASGYFPHVLPARSGAAYWAGGLVAAALLFASIFVHELAHALVARAYGIHVDAITLHVFGGVSEMPRSAATALPRRFHRGGCFGIEVEGDGEGPRDLGVLLGGDPVIGEY